MMKGIAAGILFLSCKFLRGLARREDRQTIGFEHLGCSFGEGNHLNEAEARWRVDLPLYEFLQVWAVSPRAVFPSPRPSVIVLGIPMLKTLSCLGWLDRFRANALLGFDRHRRCPGTLRRRPRPFRIGLALDSFPTQQRASATRHRLDARGEASGTDDPSISIL